MSERLAEYDFVPTVFVYLSVAPLFARRWFVWCLLTSRCLASRSFHLTRCLASRSFHLTSACLSLARLTLAPLLVSELWKPSEKQKLYICL